MGSRRGRTRTAKASPAAADHPAVAIATPRPAAILAVAALLAIVALVIYAPARHFDFVTLDDPLYVSENPHVAALTSDNVAWAWTHQHGGYWIPLVWMSYMADAAVFGPDASGHHISNVALHVLNTVLLFWLLVRVTGAIWRSGFVAALFAVHPLHVESVAWITERKDVLSGCFWMLALLAYLAYVRQRRRGRYAVLTCCFVAGLLAKPMVVPLPVVLLLLDVWPLRRYPAERWQSLVAEKAPLFALAIAGSIVAFWAQRETGAVGSLTTYSVGLRIGNALVSYVAYLWKTLWPTELAIFYSHPLAIPAWQVAGAIVLLTAITYAAVRAFRARPSVLVGWLWFLVTLVPAIGLVQVGVQGMADRFSYIPLVGIFIAAAWAIPDEVRLPRAVTAAAAAATIAACAVASRYQLAYWQNSVTLWTRATEIALGFDRYRAHISLGDVLSAQGRADEAIGHFSEATRIQPNAVEARHKLGLALAGRGRLEEAAAAFAEVIRLDPRSAAGHADLGLAYSKLGKPDRAIEQYGEALRVDPNQPDAHNSLGALLAQSGQMHESIPHFAEAVRLRPDFELAHQNLAIAFVNVDRLDDAEREFKEVQRLNPRNDIANRALGDLARRKH